MCKKTVEFKSYVLFLMVSLQEILQISIMYHYLNKHFECKFNRVKLKHF